MPLYLNVLQFGETVEVYSTIINNVLCVTKRSKIFANGLVCPRLLREMSILKHLSNPPKHLVDHPGRNHIINLIDTRIEGSYLCLDIECADGVLNKMVNTHNVYSLKEKILIDISKGLHYIHEMGYNHGDISLNNIAYFINGDQFPRFVLIDFGNAYYKNRPYTIELSTFSTMSLEIIELNQIVLNIGKQCRKNQIRPSKIRTDYIKQLNKKLTKLPINLTPDIWSLGAISYYLHTFDHYVIGNSLLQQKDMILQKHIQKHKYKKQSIGDEIKGIPEFVDKTNKMLTTSHILRPIIYFTNNRKNRIGTYRESEERKIKTINYNNNKNENNKIINRKTNKTTLYHMCILNLLDNIEKVNKKNYYINTIDNETLIRITDSCSKIESFMINYVLKNRKKIKNTKYYVIDLLCFNRLIIVWMVAHIYMSDVWRIDDVINYIQRTKMIGETNKYAVCILIKKTFSTILESISWDLESFCQ